MWPPLHSHSVNPRCPQFLRSPEQFLEDVKTKYLQDDELRNYFINNGERRKRGDARKEKRMPHMILGDWENGWTLTLEHMGGYKEQVRYEDLQEHWLTRKATEEVGADDTKRWAAMDELAETAGKPRWAYLLPITGTGLEGSSLFWRANHDRSLPIPPSLQGVGSKVRYEFDPPLQTYLGKDGRMKLEREQFCNLTKDQQAYLEHWGIEYGEMDRSDAKIHSRAGWSYTRTVGIGAVGWPINICCSE